MLHTVIGNVVCAFKVDQRLGRRGPIVDRTGWRFMRERVALSETLGPGAQFFMVAVVSRLQSQ